MSTTTAKFLLVTVVSTLCAQMVFSCMCMPQHPQTDFCMSHFVFRGKVISKTPVYGGMNPSMPARIVYSIRPRPIYRNQGTTITLKDGDAVNVTTSGYQATCGATKMEPGKIYLVTAKEIGGEVVINLCAWNSLFGQVGPSQRRMLQSDYYPEACAQTPQCEVRKYCGAPEPEMCQEFVGCTYYEDDDCDVRHSYCTWRNGECAWQQKFAGRYRDCLDLAK